MNGSEKWNEVVKSRDTTTSKGVEEMEKKRLRARAQDVAYDNT